MFSGVYYLASCGWKAFLYPRACLQRVKLMFVGISIYAFIFTTYTITFFIVFNLHNTCTLYSCYIYSLCILYYNISLLMYMYCRVCS